MRPFTVSAAFVSKIDKPKDHGPGVLERSNWSPGAKQLDMFEPPENMHVFWLPRTPAPPGVTSVTVGGVHTPPVRRRGGHKRHSWWGTHPSCDAAGFKQHTGRVCEHTPPLRRLVLVLVGLVLVSAGLVLASAGLVLVGLVLVFRFGWIGYDLGGRFVI